MTEIENAYQEIFIDKDPDYIARFVIENNFNAVQYKLATYGIAVNSTLEAYIAVIQLKGTNAFKDVLNVPYLKNATNGTGGLSSAPAGALGRNLLDGFNNLISNLTDGDLIRAVGSSFSNVIGSATGGLANITTSALGGVSNITAPLLGGIVPTAQNKTEIAPINTATKDNKTILIVAIIAFVMLGVGAYFVFVKKEKKS